MFRLKVDATGSDIHGRSGKTVYEESSESGQNRSEKTEEGSAEVSEGNRSRRSDHADRSVDDPVGLRPESAPADVQQIHIYTST